ncbi:MAG: carbon storage regulator [Pseudomonadota bacterium]
MLYLTRKVGEAIIINEVIEVTLIEIQGKSVKLGFKFPDTEKVLRRELYDKIKAETHAASHDILAIQKALSTEKGSVDVVLPDAKTRLTLPKSYAK